MRIPLHQIDTQFASSISGVFVLFSFGWTWRFLVGFCLHGQIKVRVSFVGNRGGLLNGEGSEEALVSSEESRFEVLILLEECVVNFDCITYNVESSLL